jgi:hypothetical protein
MTTITKERKGGRINPELMYTADAVMADCKIGRTTLREMRRQGLIKPIELANQLFYDGAELINAVKAFGKRK